MAKAGQSVLEVYDQHISRAGRKGVVRVDGASMPYRIPDTSPFISGSRKN